MNYLDLIAVAIIAVFVFLDYRQGLVLSLFKLLSFALSISASFFLYPLISALLKSTAVNGMIYDIIAKSITVENIHKLPDFVSSSFLSEGAKQTNEYLHTFLTNIAINAISMISVFIIVSVGLNVVSHVLKIVTKLPVINGLNKIGGIFTGLIKGFVVIWLLSVVLAFMVSMPNNERLLKDVNDSFIASKLVNGNITADLLLK